MNLSFGLIGAAGYIAPKHMEAIYSTGNQLVAAYDPFDSVGILDRYFPNADFFTEFERFDRHLDKLRRNGRGIDYLSICSPNYLHDAHIRFGLRNFAHVICEKPVVLNPWNLDALSDLESEFRTKIFTIQQLRSHSESVRLKEKVDNQNKKEKHQVELTYITPRGNWYYASWKSKMEKSGGIITNIGIHLFDLLLWVFGREESSELHVHTHDRAAGILNLEKAEVKWFLSINGQTIPDSLNNTPNKAFRSLVVDDDLFDWSSEMDNLHTISYKHILNGQGLGLEDSRPALEVSYKVREMNPTGHTKYAHSMAFLPIVPHPFEKNKFLY
ncbi:MAG TPA: Gfo/Idh/MocA family oxidoreductase [Saprospiraceae bacterium]|nr:Gfo/Idh/MocA family oxidoreductase [Saprospiraceae bacterium]